MDLRELTLADLDFVAEMLADADVTHFLPRRYSRVEAEQWLRAQMKSYESHGHGHWLAVDRMSQASVGLVGIVPFELDGVEEAALTWLIHRPFWGLGLATEAAAACRDHVFDALGRAWVISLVRPENLASLRVAQKLGLKPQRVVSYAGSQHWVLSRGQT